MSVEADQVPNGFDPDLGLVKAIQESESVEGLLQNVNGSENFVSKPPIGIIPRKFHEENRITDLTEAINRYLSDGRLLPEEWVDELNELLYNRIDRKVEA